MKKIAELAVLSIAFTLALAPISSTHAWPGVTGKTFRVTVKSSFNTTFTDCFRFDALGDLTIDGLGELLIYRYGNLDAVKYSFKAVSFSGEPFSIMFYGTEVDALEWLNGEAVSEFGDTFVFTGPQNATCVPDAAASRSGTSRYKQ